jgi:DNA-binding NtrC family response regulator
MQETILVIDDTVLQSQLKEHLSRYRLLFQDIRSNPEAAIGDIMSGKSQQPDAMLLDLVTLGDAGLKMIRSMRETKPDFPIVVFTRYGDRDHAAAAMQAGAHDFLTKPVVMERLRLTLQHAIRIRRMHRYIDWLERKVAGHVDFSDIVGENPAFRRAVNLSREASPSKFPVWIEGEEGTGKELIARAIHGGGDRAGKPFVVVHCETLPEAMVEAVLFGQDKGFQPSSMQFALGRLRAADTGTLMLKEVGAFKPSVQRQLIQFLTTGAITPVGGSAPVKLDVRLICVTSKPSKHYVPGDIAPVLMQKLKRHVITLLSLQERKGDTARLAEHFLTLYATSENKYIQGMTDHSLQWLINCPWPGNVAQLSHLIWRAVLLCDTQQLDVSDLQAVQKSKPIYFADPPRELAAAVANVLIDEKGRVKTLKSVEEDAIRFALQYSNGCMARAARSLGIGRSTLYRKVGELEIDGYISRANQTMRPIMDTSPGERS